MALAHLGDPLRLDLAAVERAQRRQPAHHVEEMIGEERQRQPALARALFGVAANQPHEHRHERQRREHDQRRHVIDRRHPREHRDRHEDREHDLRQVARVVGLQRVDPLHCGRRQLAPMHAVERRGLGAQAALEQRQAQFGEYARGAAAPRRLKAPCQDAAPSRDEHQQEQFAAKILQWGAVKRTCHHARQQRRLQENQQRTGEPQRHIHAEQRSHRARTLGQARVKRAHRRAASSGPGGRAASEPMLFATSACTTLPSGCSPPTRARNT